MGGRECAAAPPRQLCLVFDLDDTLFLERDYVLSGFEAVGEWVWKTLRLPHFADRAWRLFESGCRGRVFDAVLADSGLEPHRGLVEDLVRVYRTHAPRITPLPDAVDCLSFFHGSAILALVTDGPVISQQQKLRALGLFPFFEIVLFTGMWGEKYSKPHSRAFRDVQTRLAGGDRRFIYVGDNPAKDFIAPASLGWETVRVRRSHGLYTQHEAPIGGQPDIELPDLSGLRDVVSR